MLSLVEAEVARGRGDGWDSHKWWELGKAIDRGRHCRRQQVMQTVDSVDCDYIVNGGQ